MSAVSLFVFIAALQLGVEHPLAPATIGRAASSAVPNLAITIGNERAVVWTEDRRVWLSRLDAENHNLGPATLLNVTPPRAYADVPTSMASDGATIAIAYVSQYGTQSHIDLIHRDGTIDASTYTTKSRILQVASNGHGYLVRDATSITPLDETGHVTGSPLAINTATAKIIVLGGRYLFLAKDLFGIGARWLDERGMTIGDRMHVPARGPDAQFADAAASRRGFAVLWSEPIDYYNTRLWVTQHDDHGAVTSAATFVDSANLSHDVHVAANGSEYVVVAANAYSIDSGGRVQRLGLPSHHGTPTNLVAADGDPVLIAWGDGQVYAMTPPGSIRRRIGSDVIVSLRERDQHSPRTIEIDGRAYVAWIEHDDPDAIVIAAFNGERSALEQPPRQMPTVGPRLANLSLTTDGTSLFVTWDEPPFVVIARLDRDLKVERQTKFAADQTQASVPLAVVTDASAHLVITRSRDGTLDVHRFSYDLADLGIETIKPLSLDFDYAAVAWTGSDYLIAYSWYGPLPYGRLSAYARMPRLDFAPRTTTTHNSLVPTADITPALAFSPSAVLVSGDSMAWLSTPSRETWLDAPPPNTHPHAIWNPSGWFLLMNGAYLLRVDESVAAVGRASLGDDIAETNAITNGVNETLVYERNGRLFVRSLQ